MNKKTPSPQHYLPSQSLQHYLCDALADLLCLASLLGIYPRYIESQRLHLEQITLTSLKVPPAWRGLRILHLSDLHLNRRLSPKLIDQLQGMVAKSKADLIVFTGDFLCYSDCDNWKRLEEILGAWKAPLGIYATLGNHDYTTYVTLHRAVPSLCPDPKPFLYRALEKVWEGALKEDGELIAPSSAHAPLSIHPTLEAILERCKIKLLQSESETLQIAGHPLHLLGFEDQWTKGVRALELFFERSQHKIGPSFHEDWKLSLCHNPQIWPYLRRASGHQIVLSGHTHGGNVDLPFLHRRLRNVSKETPLSGSRYGENNTFLQINRGIGSPYPFRLFAPPQITLLEFAP